VLRPRLALSLAVAALTACAHHHSSEIPATSSSASPGPTSAPGTLTQSLWVANGTSVLEFTPSQIAAGGNQRPLLVNANTLFGDVGGVAFDAAGDLWVVDGGTLVNGGAARPAVYEFSPAQLGSLNSNQSPIPTRTIEFSGFNFPQLATFDAGGDLWVSDAGSNAVYEFTPSQLTAGGFNVTPNVEIAGNPPFSGALGIAFSSAGNLWVANGSGTTIEGFDADTLPTAYGSEVTLQAQVTLQNNGQTIAAPFALAFDKSGNLWATNTDSADGVVKFPASTLGASGSPSALVISSGSVNGNATLETPTGLAFDSGGDLAVASAGEPFGIAVYAAAQLGAGGSYAPHYFIVGPNTTLATPGGVAFGPVIN
jgi:sugar lactone lactonase YvrE